MSFNGSEGVAISATDSQTMQTDFARDFPGQVAYVDFPTSQISGLLNQSSSNIKGIRCYFGWDSAASAIKAVIVATESSEDDYIGDIYMDGNSATVSETTAGAYTSSWRASYSSYGNGHFIGQDNFNTLLAATGVTDIRFTFGVENSKAVVIVRPVDSSGLPIGSTEFERGLPCPPCGQANGLNT